MTVLASLTLGVWVALVGFGVLPSEDLLGDVLGDGIRLALLPLAGILGGAFGAWLRRRRGSSTARGGARSIASA